MSAEYGAVPGCALCSKYRSTVTIAEVDLGQAARRRSGVTSAKWVSYWNTIIEERKANRIIQREMLASHLKSDHGGSLATCEVVAT